MKKANHLLLSIFFCPALLFGQDNTAILIDSLKKYIQKNHIPGAMLSIVRSDSIIYVDGIGYADKEKKEKANEKHLFRQGSISKSFTAISLVHLLKQKELSIETPIKDIDANIPFKNKWADIRRITVASVLENSAGFDDFHAHAVYNFIDEEQISAAAMVESHKNSLYTRWEPDTRHAYSNSGYVLSGYLIEKLSGQPYSEYIYKNILVPLGMKESGFYFKQPDKSFAQGHGDGAKPIPFASINAGPAGDFCSNAEEMALYLQFMLKRKGDLIDSNIFSDKTFDRIENAQTTLAAKNGLPGGYGLGNFSVWKNGHLFHGHNGAIDGFSSRYIYSREADLGIAIAVNRLKDPTPMVEIILNHLLGQPDTSTLKRPVEKIPEELKKEFSGFYVFRNPRQQLKAFIDGFANNFKLEFSNNKGYFKDILGGTRDSITYAGNNLFYRNIETTPSVVLMHSIDGNQAVGMKRNYAEKESFFLRMLYNITVLLSIAALFLFIGYYGVWFIVQLVKKKKLELLDRTILLAGCLSFPTFMFSFISAVSIRETSGQLTFWSGLFYIMSFSMIIFLLGSFYRMTKLKESRSFKAYYFLTTLALLMVIIFLGNSGYIGLKLWAY